MGLLEAGIAVLLMALWVVGVIVIIVEEVE